MNQYEPTELAKEMIDYLDCTCQVLKPTSDDATILDAYFTALEEGKKQGYTPMLVTVDEVLWECLIMNADEENESDFELDNVRNYRKKLLAKPMVDDIAERLYRQLNDRREEYEVDGISWNGLLAKVENGVATDRFACYFSYGSHSTNEVILAKIPTANPWEVFAWLPMGDWNDCPDAAMMMAVAKHWYESYGAIPAALSHDTLEFYVKKPITDEVTAKALAHEHYSFCTDRVEQCEDDGTVGKLADSLMKSTVWYFWWD